MHTRAIERSLQAPFGKKASSALGHRPNESNSKSLVFARRLQASIVLPVANRDARASVQALLLATPALPTLSIGSGAEGAAGEQAGRLVPAVARKVCSLRWRALASWGSVLFVGSRQFRGNFNGHDVLALIAKRVQPRVHDSSQDPPSVLTRYGSDEAMKSPP